MGMPQVHWYAIYTKGRWEKKVHKMLIEDGIESYCPLNKVLRRWSDRVKKVEEPLFKSYVFVHITPQQMQMVRETEGVVNFVFWLGKPAIIRDFEIAEIKRFMGEHPTVDVVTVDANIAPGQRLRVTSGIMMDHEATALRVHNKTVEVLIESLGIKLVATIEKKRLQRV